MTTEPNGDDGTEPVPAGPGLGRLQALETVVVGGGVVGLSCAIELARRGRSVTVLDRGPIGRGCGVGSAGHLVPSHVVPLAAPGMQRAAARALISRHGALSVDAGRMARTPRWAAEFMLACRQQPFEVGAQALGDLGRLSWSSIEEIAIQHPDLSINRSGLLDVFADRRHQAEVERSADRLTRLGVRAEVVDDREARRLEPGLVGSVACGLYLPDDASVRPADLLDALLGDARAAGVQMRSGVEVLGIESSGDRVEMIRTSFGDAAVGELVLAFGADAGRWQRELGVRLPILAGRGHSITLDRNGPGGTIGLRQPMLLGEDHVAVGPYEAEVRISGWFELGATGTEPSLERTDAVLALARRRVALPDEVRVLERWAGMRPVTPDGVPIIGRPGRWRNVIVAAGHAMVGLSFGPGSGRLVAEMISGEPTSIPVAPFSPDRFNTGFNTRFTGGFSRVRLLRRRHRATQPHLTATRGAR